MRTSRPLCATGSAPRAHGQRGVAFPRVARTGHIVVSSTTAQQNLHKTYLSTRGHKYTVVLGKSVIARRR
jgi:hypothetical protein